MIINTICIDKKATPFVLAGCLSKDYYIIFLGTLYSNIN